MKHTVIALISKCVETYETGTKTVRLPLKHGRSMTFLETAPDLA